MDKGGKESLPKWLADVEQRILYGDPDSVTPLGLWTCTMHPCEIAISNLTGIPAYISAWHGELHDFDIDQAEYERRVVRMQQNIKTCAAVSILRMHLEDFD